MCRFNPVSSRPRSAGEVSFFRSLSVLTAAFLSFFTTMRSPRGIMKGKIEMLVNRVEVSIVLVPLVKFKNRAGLGEGLPSRHFTACLSIPERAAGRKNNKYYNNRFSIL